MNKLFAKYQKPLLKLANNRFGRKYLGINPKKEIVGLSPNAFAVKDENRIKAEFRCYPLFQNKLGIALKTYDSFIEGIKYYFTPQEIRLLDFALSSGDPIYTSAGDGSVVQYQPGTPRSISWMRSQSSGTDVRATDAIVYTTLNPWSSGASPNILTLGRGFLPFITSAIGETATKESAYLAIYANAVMDEWPNESESRMDVILTTQASMTTLVLADYSKITLNSPDVGTARVDVGDLTASQYNNFNLNETGLGWIDIEGNTKLGIREGHDIDNQPADSAYGDNSHHSGMNWYASEEADIDKDPKLIVTYTIPGGSAFLMNFI